jgi:hypothetical protein
MSAGFRRELLILAVLLVFGLIGLPYSIYAVGALVFGLYEGEGGGGGIALAVWAGLGRFEWAPWLLVSSPYIVIQLWRLSLRVGRSRNRVKPVTD